MARRTEDIEREILNVSIAQTKALEDARSASRTKDSRAQKDADTRLSSANSRLSALRNELNAAQVQAERARSARR